MNVLEKILEEIEDHAIEFESFGMCDDYVSVGWAKEIIRSHMDDVADNNDGWIPVSEKLPEDERMVLVTCQTKKGIRSTNRAYYDGKFWHGSGSMSGVTAWQPLPEPYKEK
ncbi:DUF551 domain-containing protein [Mediterraneibacter gnavus]|jgi:hypothetical protein|uniref:DUF551 domain-containing protein n=1 Tax=Mediterraneibacter gnavus TaxID=33038 RepID=UPI00046759AC|nr:DUF551 domain-containing protein [Mediterraneibacter gnavus]